MPRLAPPRVRVPAPSSPARRPPRVMGPARARATASPGAAPLVAGQAVKIADPAVAKDPRFQKTMDKLQLSASKLRRHPPAASKAAEAQAAAQGPANEKIAGAKAGLVDELREAETAKPQPQSFLAVLRAEIAKAMPKTLGDTEHFMEGEKKQELKGALAGNVSQQKEAASSGMKAAASQPPDPSRVEAKEVTPMPAEASPAPAAIDAAGAMPAAKPDAEVSLQQRKQDASAMLGEAKVTPAQLQKANDPRFTAVLTAKAGVEKHADTAPATYRAAEQKTLTQAVIQSVAEERKGLGQFTQVRGRSANDVKSGQLAAKQRDEQRRKKVADDIEAIYNRTKQGVDDQLARIDGEVSDMFDKGMEAALQKMTAHIDSRMLRWKLVRYGSSLGLMWIKDKLLGLPDEVNVFYEEGRAIFTRELDAAIVGIANHVEMRLKEAKAAISAGQAQIRVYVSKLDPDLQAIGQAAERDMAGRFDELRQGVENKKSDLAQSLAQRYKEAHDKAGEQLKAMQEENKGLLVAMKEKLAAVAEALRNFRTRVMSMLKKGQETIELIVADPIQFLKNLLEAVKKGLNQFVDNIWTHLKAGFLAWMFGTLKDAGIQVPAQFTPGSILLLILQILGITYEKMRAKAVKLIGPRAVAIIEAVGKAIYALITVGPEQLWEQAKEFVGNLKETIVQGIQDWVVASVIKAAITKLATMFNPVGAIVQAILTIYNTVMFFIERINQILEFVEAIINSVYNIATGAIGGAANWIEKSLARTVPLIIAFLARLLGLGGLSDKIREIVKKIQTTVDKAIDKVIEKIVLGIKKLFGKDDKPATEKDQERLDKAMASAEAYVNTFAGKKVTKFRLGFRLFALKAFYRLKTLEPVPEGDKWAIVGEINPASKKTTQAGVIDHLAEAEAKASELNDRAVFLHSLLEGSELISPTTGEISRKMTTTAVAFVRSSEGRELKLVASSEARLAPPQHAHLASDEEEVVGAAGIHAEQKIIVWALARGYEVIAVAASRPICPACLFAINSAGAVPVTESNRLPI